jgi:Sulfotransferase domain
MGLPTFVVIGAMKCGTSSLWSYLDAHPQVYMAPKEIDFFIDRTFYGRGMDWYRSQFDGSDGFDAAGDVSPVYTSAQWFPEVAPRIAEQLPDVRLIYVMRHPYERMVSHYLHQRAAGEETRPPDEAFRRELGYLHTSRYAYQLGYYLEVFPRERILLMTAERLRDRRTEEMRRVFEFIGVDPDVVPAALDRVVHRTADKRVRRGFAERLRKTAAYRAAAKLAPQRGRLLVNRLSTKPLPAAEEVHISDETYAKIVAALADDVRELRRIMPADFDGWGLA